MRTLFSAALVALALTVLPPSALAEKQKLTAVSGPVSGGWYLGVGLVAKAFTDANPEYEVTMLPGNSTSNVIQLQQRKADLSIGMRTMNMAAIEGRSPYKKAFPNIAAYANLNDTALFHFVATKKSGITSIAQIRDQKMPIRLAYGAVGGSGEVFCGWVFEGYGFGYKDIRSWGGKLYSNNFDDIVNMAKDGQLDVIVWVGPGESWFFTELVQNIDFRARPPFKSFLKLSLYKPWRPLPADPAQWGAFELGREPNVTADAHDMDAFVREMDENGIVKAVLMGRHADDFGVVDNDELYELTRLYPGRFIPFAGINPREEGAVEEVERCLGTLGFKGISVDPGWLNPPLKGDDPLFEPVYAKCNDMGGILVMSVSAALGPDLTYSDPIIVQHVATRYPDMKIVVAHACWPHVERMLAVAMRCPNVYLVPDCYVYIDCMPFADTYVEAANSFLKYRTIFGSTYPERSLKQTLEGWKKRPWEAEALELSLYGNAARLLGID